MRGGKLVAAAVAPAAAGTFVVRVLGVQRVTALRALTEDREARRAGVGGWRKRSV
ncbi:MAG: hypothetical protein ACKOYI_13880 [Actinomycetota bacterium]